MDMGNRNRPSFARVVPHNKISGQLPYPWQQQQRYGQVLWVLVIMQCWIIDARLWTLTKGFSLSLLRAGNCVLVCFGLVLDIYALFLF